MVTECAPRGTGYVIVVYPFVASVCAGHSDEVGVGVGAAAVGERPCQTMEVTSATASSATRGLKTAVDFLIRATVTREN
jgi:hypothetical protein